MVASPEVSGNLGTRVGLSPVIAIAPAGGRAIREGTAPCGPLYGNDKSLGAASRSISTVRAFSRQLDAEQPAMLRHPVSRNRAPGVQPAPSPMPPSPGRPAG